MAISCLLRFNVYMLSLLDHEKKAEEAVAQVGGPLECIKAWNVSISLLMTALEGLLCCLALQLC